MNVKTVGVLALMLVACERKAPVTETSTPHELTGTWQLITGVTIQKGDTTTTDYRENQRMIKIINDTHFAFLNHDLKKGQDSTAMFISGGGTYSLAGDQYTENLEYCNYREWEGKSFHFTVTVKNDTLVQRGVEEVAEAGVSREIIETYARSK
ncbi:MAG TPA: hypothetical protein VIN08_00360 [Ohtaekwangia sp.]|uniref:hypothetical protein n=1 Tax=Ohtaekwangia sp. TaxID=2066019 RepID=UPI002F924861